MDRTTQKTTSDPKKSIHKELDASGRAEENETICAFEVVKDHQLKEIPTYFYNEYDDNGVLKFTKLYALSSKEPHPYWVRCRYCGKNADPSEDRWDTLEKVQKGLEQIIRRGWHGFCVARHQKTGEKTNA